jgi:hypothetical protein
MLDNSEKRVCAMRRRLIISLGRGSRVFETAEKRIFVMAVTLRNLNIATLSIMAEPLVLGFELGGQDDHGTHFVACEDGRCHTGACRHSLYRCRGW